MRIIRVFILLLLVIGCAEKKVEKQLSDFENIIGKENIETLDYLVSDFENNFLKKQYPNLDTEHAYKKYLTDIKNGHEENFLENSEKSKRLFEESQLRFEIYCVADSTWIETNPWNDKTLLIKARTKCLNPDGTFSNGFIEKPFDETDISQDSMLISYGKAVRSNHFGSYLKALTSLSDHSKFFKDYADARNTQGYIPSYLIAEMILESNINFKDSYIRKIIVIDIALEN